MKKFLRGENRFLTDIYAICTAYPICTVTTLTTLPPLTTIWVAMAECTVCVFAH